MEINGSKTYIVAAATIFYAVAGWYLGFLNQNEVVYFLTLGLGFAGLRHGIGKIV